jgi:bifunctional DNA-binding transcriptional regulator/antitoxin component of YhaV-PrlF toxin-antitoxin module
MMQVAVQVEKSGRILIPVAIRRRLKLVEGESQVLLRVDDSGEIQLSTRAQALARVRAEVRKYIPEGSNIVEEFLAEKRAEVAREDSK